MSRRTIIPAIASAVLTAAIALPALAGPPTYSGVISCTSGGEHEEMLLVTNWTRKQIREAGVYWTSTGFCEKGSWDTSALTKD